MSALTNMANQHIPLLRVYIVMYFFLLDIEKNGNTYSREKKLEMN